MKTEVMNKQVDTELYRLGKGFKALTADHKKWILKAACGLLKIQRTQNKIVVDNTKYFDASFKGKK